MNLSYGAGPSPATAQLGLLPVLLGVVGILAGGIAPVSGFGIGSLLTPVLALQVGVKLAVAVVAVPHAVDTAQRFWLLRRTASGPGGLYAAWRQLPVTRARWQEWAVASIFSGYERSPDDGH